MSELIIKFISNSPNGKYIFRRIRVWLYLFSQFAYKGHNITVRCGTSFLFVVIVVSILLSSVLFSFVEVTNTFARMGLHLLLLPVIVSLTYELNRVVGRYDNRLTRLVSAPGMWLQNWTTFEPDDSMIEVGIRAFTLVLPEEKGKDQW